MAHKSTDHRGGPGHKELIGTAVSFASNCRVGQAATAWSSAIELSIFAYLWALTRHGSPALLDG